MNEWKPIETAPKDGTWILVAKFVHEGGSGPMTFRWASGAKWSRRYKFWNDGTESNAGLHEPSHWMQPELPK